MEIVWLRDLSLTIFGFLGSLAFIIMIVVAVLAYRKIKPSLDSAKVFAKRLENISARVENEVLKPIVEVMIAIRVIRQVIGEAKKFFRKKGEKGERKE